MALIRSVFCLFCSAPLLIHKRWRSVFLDSMNFLDRLISETFETSTEQNKEAILKRINKFKDKEEFVEFDIKDEEVAMLRSPTALSPFHGYGRIKVKLKSHDDKTVIVCQIHPYDDNFTIIVFIGIALMVLWTAASYIISPSGGIFLITIGWSMTIVGVISYLLLNKFLLRVFTKYFMRTIAE